MIERELKRQLDLLFEADRVMLDRVTRLAEECLVLQERIRQLESGDDFKDSFFEGVIEKGDNWQVYHTATDGKRELLPPRFDLGHHSPDGFSWGYVGSGPSQLALGMLAEHLRDPVLEVNSSVKARRLANAFMWQVVAKLPMDQGWSMTSCDIDDWLSGMGEL